MRSDDIAAERRGIQSQNDATFYMSVFAEFSAFPGIYTIV